MPPQKCPGPFCQGKNDLTEPEGLPHVLCGGVGGLMLPKVRRSDSKGNGILLGIQKRIQFGLQNVEKCVHIVDIEFI